MTKTPLDYFGNALKAGQRVIHPSTSGHRVILETKTVVKTEGNDVWIKGLPGKWNPKYQSPTRKVMFPERLIIHPEDL